MYPRHKSLTELNIPAFWACIVVEHVDADRERGSLRVSCESGMDTLFNVDLWIGWDESVDIQIIKKRTHN